MVIQIDDIKQGDHDCFKKVYYLYHTRLYNYIYNKTQIPFLAEDIVQSAFVKFWENRAKISDDHSIEVQLFQIAKMLLIDEYRRGNTKDKYIQWVSGSHTSHIDNDPFVAKDTLRNVIAAMEKLPPVRKKVFKLSRIDNYTYKQISSTLGLSTKTVENHISKAIKQLRTALD